jgi:glycosyltransferase involved in cell wall biosynthesis
LARAGQTDRLWLAPAVAPLLGYRGRRLRRVLNNAAWLIAPTEFVRETYQQLGAPADRIRVIPHGIEVPRSLPATPPRSSPALRVTYIGGLAWQKGVHVLVEAVAGMSAEGVHLSIYGDATVFPDYVADLKRHAQQTQIEFAGRLARADLWRVLREADVVVVPSLWYETASLIIQESFAAGVPVIASDLGALRERIADNIDGLLFAPGDSAALRTVLQRCVNEPELVRRLRDGIRPVRSIEEHVSDLEALYADTAITRLHE